MKTILLLFLTALCLRALSQDSSKKKPAFLLQGYLKEMLTVNHTVYPNSSSATNLLHHRLNLAWKPCRPMEIRGALRSRFFYGDELVSDPGFKSQILQTDEPVRLGWTLLNKDRYLLYTNIDRLFLEYRKKKWNIRVGRQRINWGITTVWNPNDLFNTYNFFDFDYEERPGSDAAKFQYLVNASSSAEVAVAATQGKPIAAVRYCINTRGYDIQVLAGSYKEQLTGGIGWAGNIGRVGFKGECQYYGAVQEKIAQLVANIQADHIFKSNFYLSGGVLYNRQGLDAPPGEWNGRVFSVTPQQPMPAKWSGILSGSKEFSPIFRGTLNIIYSPGIRLLLFYPTLQYNWKTNIDLDFVMQSYFLPVENPDLASYNFFFRLKWSY
jgi:hypothetical protein